MGEAIVKGRGPTSLHGGQSFISPKMLSVQADVINITVFRMNYPIAVTALRQDLGTIYSPFNISIPSFPSGEGGTQQ